MAELLSVAGAVCAVIGGYVLVRWLFTHKRFTAKRPRRFYTGLGLLGIAVGLFVIAGYFVP